MTKFRLPNDFGDHEARALLEVLHERASTFVDWGYDDTNFWVELDAQARNPWPYLLRELFERLDAPSDQAQRAMVPLSRPDAGNPNHRKLSPLCQNRA